MTPATQSRATAAIDERSEAAAQAPRGDWMPVIIVCACLLGTAAGLYLLRELAPLVRPLILAVFVSYIIIPIHTRLRQHISPTLSIITLATISVLVLYALAAMIMGNVLALNDDLPRLVARTQQLTHQAREQFQHVMPSWLMDSRPSPAPPTPGSGLQWLRGAMMGVVNHAAQVFGEAVVVGFYLVFILIESRRFPDRVRAGFSHERATQLFEIARSINQGMMNYFRIKVLASFFLAAPATLIFWACGLKFPVMWGLLIFVGNFIPYVGSIVAFVFPVALAFLDLQPAWKPFILLALLGINQFVNNNIIEPLITARAVNLSPTFVLFSLTFWGLTWGIMGMFLAVPLTVMIKTILENVPITSPLAQLMTGSVEAR